MHEKIYFTRTQSYLAIYQRLCQKPEVSACDSFLKLMEIIEKITIKLEPCSKLLEQKILRESHPIVIVLKLGDGLTLLPQNKNISSEKLLQLLPNFTDKALVH